uniref:Minor tail T domain-containing protein n=1 Tax=viral metagenome TaxID=1070528 RepID=A0A6M3JZN1_9ZZZZ
MTLAQFNALAERFSSSQEREDYHSALICCVLAEINRDRKKRPKPFTPQDFMPQVKELVTTESLKEKIKLLNMVMGGKEKKHGKRNQ